MERRNSQKPKRLLCICDFGTFRNATEQRRFAYGAVGSDGGGPKHAGTPESALGLPSPVDAFHRPQAPAPPHVTTPHERAPRVDGTVTTNHARNRLSRTFFRPTHKETGHRRGGGARP